MKWRIIGCRVDYVGLPGHWACAATVEWVDAKNKSRTSKVECSASQYWEARELLGELLGGSCPAWFETAAPAWVAEVIGGREDRGMADVNDSRDDVPDGCEAAASCFYCGGRLLMRFGLWRHDGPLYAERRHQPIPHPSSIVRRDMWTGEIRAGGGEGTP